MRLESASDSIGDSFLRRHTDMKGHFKSRLDTLQEVSEKLEVTESMRTHNKTSSISEIKN